MSLSDPDLLDHLTASLTPVPERLGVAVSGGGDSLALLHLLATSMDRATVIAATVDHGLRDESATEAAAVAEICQELGISHTILTWQGWDGRGNLQDQARRARYRLLTEWAQDRGAPVLALGHTADDQAETVLMQLARGAGVNGLSAMPTRRIENKVTLLRPLLGVRRADLRAYLRRHDVSWVDDPSNDDPRFARIRTRQMLEALDPLGLTVSTLCDVARNMQRARASLEQQVFRIAKKAVQIRQGNVVIDLQALVDMPDDALWRLLTHAIRWITGADYVPRGHAMQRLITGIRAGHPATLAGCRFFISDGDVWISREFAAVSGPVASDQIWDRRWRIADAPKGAVLGALGPEGVQRLAPLSESALPRIALESTPSLWHQGELIAAPLAGIAPETAFEPLRSDDEFFTSLLSH